MCGTFFIHYYFVCKQLKILSSEEECDKKPLSFEGKKSVVRKKI